MDADHAVSERADVVVIGGGPAGSAAALRLARRGLHVVQLERRVFLNPRSDHLRSGEGLIPRVRRELAELDRSLCPAAWTLSTIQSVQMAWPDGTHTIDDIASHGGIVQIDREAFDHDLFGAAQRAGADGRQGWRARQLYRDDRGRIAGVLALPPGEQTPRCIRAPVVVDAGGRNALTLRELALQPLHAGDDFFAMAMFFDQVAGLEPGSWEMHLFDPPSLAIVQLSLLRDRLARCGLGTTERLQRGVRQPPCDFFWSRIQRSPELARRLEHSQIVQRPFVRAGIGYRVPQVTFDGMLLVGDAAGYLNPLFGDGILRALCGARHAATAVESALRRGDCSRASFARYEQRHALRDCADQLLKKLMLGAHRSPDRLGRVGSVRLLRRALLAALMRG